MCQLQRWLNQRVEPFQQEPVEVIINGLSNVKAKEGLLQEICYNFLHVDNETLGCRVIRPHVTVFYEATSELFNAKFAHFRNFGRLAPFESIAQFEFIPYPRNATNLGGNNTCPLEDDHCMANWIHGCLVKMHYDNVQDQFLFMQFFMCTSSAQEKSPLDQARECVHQVYDGYGPNFWESIVDCAQNDSNLKEEFRKKSEAIKLQEMPEIVIDGQVKTHEVGDHLLGYLCNSFHQIRPRACFEIDDHSVATVTLTVFLSGDSSSQDFVLSQMKPLLVSEPRDPSLRLRDVINWQFVPWGPSLFNEDGGSIKCRNGVNECLVNRILTCASVNFRENDQLGIRKNRLRVVSFVVCLFDSALWQTSPLEAANQCSNILSPNVDTYPQLWQCTIQESKKQMMLEMKQLTDNNYPPLDTFPVVAINTQRPQLITNLVQVLCSHFKAGITPMPAECTVPVETTDTPQQPTTKPPSGGTAKENPLWLLWAITAAIMLCS